MCQLTSNLYACARARRVAFHDVKFPRSRTEHAPIRGHEEAALTTREATRGRFVDKVESASTRPVMDSYPMVSRTILPLLRRLARTYFSRTCSNRWRYCRARELATFAHAVGQIRSYDRFRTGILLPFIHRYLFSTTLIDIRKTIYSSFVPFAIRDIVRTLTRYLFLRNCQQPPSKKLLIRNVRIVLDSVLVLYRPIEVDEIPRIRYIKSNFAQPSKHFIVTIIIDRFTVEYLNFDSGTRNI